MKRRGGTSRILIVVFAIVAVAVVAVGSRTLRGGEELEDLTFSQLIERVEQSPQEIELVTFKPIDREIEIELAAPEGTVGRRSTTRARRRRSSSSARWRRRGSSSTRRARAARSSGRS